MFELTNQQAKLTSFNPRAEMHGEDPTPAADIKFETNVPAELLVLFDPTLRSFLYCKRDGIEGGDLANQASRASEAPNLRYPKLGGPLKWDMDIVGATLTIHHGLGGKSDLIIPGCKVNAFTLAPQEGGTCIIGFRVQCKPDEKQSGKLCFMVAESVEITIEPPDETTADIDEDAPKPRRGRRATADATA